MTYRTTEPDATAPRRGRRPYHAPRLIEYGDITRLTQNGQGSGADGGIGANMMMMCL